MQAQFQHGHLHSRVSPKGILLIILAILSVLALISGPRSGRFAEEREGVYARPASEVSTGFVSGADRR